MLRNWIRICKDPNRSGSGSDAKINVSYLDSDPELNPASNPASNPYLNPDPKYVCKKSLLIMSNKVV